MPAVLPQRINSGALPDASQAPSAVVSLHVPSSRTNARPSRFRRVPDWPTRRAAWLADRLAGRLNDDVETDEEAGPPPADDGVCGRITCTSAIRFRSGTLPHPVSKVWRSSKGCAATRPATPVPNFGSTAGRGGKIPLQPNYVVAARADDCSCEKLPGRSVPLSGPLSSPVSHSTKSPRVCSP